MKRVIGGDPSWSEVAASTSRKWRWTGRESDRGVLPLNPGNAGGGKGPDFCHAFEAGEEMVIGDEPRNAR